MSIYDDFCTECGRHFDCCVCHLADDSQREVPGCVHKGWTIEYKPKPGRPGCIDWDATHPDHEQMYNGKSINDLMDQIDAL